jgi:hypothetical protein
MRQQMAEFLLWTSLPVRVPAERYRCNYRGNIRKSEESIHDKLSGMRSLDYDIHNDS